MGTAYFFVEDNTFPLIRYGQPPENFHFSDNRIGSRFDPGMYIEVATATDQSLMEWCLSGSLKSGRVEFRDYSYPGSLKALVFEDACADSYREESDPVSVMLPRLIFLHIIPGRMFYE
jgi:hypothetical protein